MNMEMDIKQKDSLFAMILYEHFITQGQMNPFFVSTKHFLAKGLMLSDVSNVCARFKRNGLIIATRPCVGFWADEISFVVTSTEKKMMRDDEVEAYQIRINMDKFLLHASSQSLAQKTIEIRANKVNHAGVATHGGVPRNAMITVYLNAQGDLYKEPKDKFCYPMSGKGVPIKILKYFADNPNTDYELDTASTAAAIGISTDQLRKEINKMKSPIKNSLKLKIDVIEGRKNSGYRLNPNIEMSLES